MPKKLPIEEHRISVTFRIPPDLYSWLLIATAEATVDAGEKVTKSEWIAACMEVVHSHPHRARLVREAIDRRRSSA